MGNLWNRSGTIERYSDDIRARGAKAFFYAGGTTTPMVVYQDSSEAAAHAFPVVADANGRWPDVFVPYTDSYDVRVTTDQDVQLTFSQRIPNPNPVEVTVPGPVGEVIKTGHIHAELINGTKAGFVRLNGKTIGNASSAGTERQNADCHDLFIYLWNIPTIVIAGGRSGSPEDDWGLHNKTAQLPDFRGAIPIGLDDMGNLTGSNFTGSTFGPTAGPENAAGSAIVGASTTGNNVITTLLAHTHTGTTVTEGAHTHSGTTGIENAVHSHSGTTNNEGSHTHTFSGTTSGENVQHTHAQDARTVIAVAGASGAPGGTPVAQQGGTTGVNSVDHTHTFSGTTGAGSLHSHTFATGNESANHGHPFTTGAGTAHSHTFTSDSTGSATPSNISKAITVTWFIKL